MSRSQCRCVNHRAVSAAQTAWLQRLCHPKCHPTDVTCMMLWVRRLRVSFLRDFPKAPLAARPPQPPASRCHVERTRKGTELGPGRRAPCTCWQRAGLAPRTSPVGDPGTADPGRAVPPQSRRAQRTAGRGRGGGADGGGRGAPCACSPPTSQ